MEGGDDGYIENMSKVSVSSEESKEKPKPPVNPRSWAVCFGTCILRSAKKTFCEPLLLLPPFCWALLCGFCIAVLKNTLEDIIKPFAFGRWLIKSLFNSRQAPIHVNSYVTSVHQFWSKWDKKHQKYEFFKVKPVFLKFVFSFTEARIFLVNVFLKQFY